MLTILNSQDTNKSFRLLGDAGDYCDFIVTSLPINVELPSGSYSTTFKAATGGVTQESTDTGMYAETDLSLLGMANSTSLVSYSGTNCNVRLQFFTKKNFYGNWIRFSVYKPEGTLTLTNYWATKVNSYKFYYP